MKLVYWHSFLIIRSCFLTMAYWWRYKLGQNLITRNTETKQSPKTKTKHSRPWQYITNSDWHRGHYQNFFTQILQYVAQDWRSRAACYEL